MNSLLGAIFLCQQWKQMLLGEWFLGRSNRMQHDHTNSLQNNGLDLRRPWLLQFAKFSLCTCKVLFTTRVDKSYLVYMTTFMLRYVEQITSYGKEFFGLRCGRNFTGHDKRITFGRQGTSSTRLFTCSAHAQWVIGLYLFLFMTEKTEWMRFI